MICEECYAPAEVFVQVWVGDNYDSGVLCGRCSDKAHNMMGKYLICDAGSIQEISISDYLERLPKRECKSCTLDGTTGGPENRERALPSPVEERG